MTEPREELTSPRAGERALDALIALRQELESQRHSWESDWWLTTDDERADRRRELDRLGWYIEALDLAIGTVREEERHGEQ